MKLIPSALLILALLAGASIANARVSHRLDGDTLRVECQKPKGKKVKPCKIYVGLDDTRATIEVYENLELRSFGTSWSMYSSTLPTSKRVAVYQKSAVKRIVLLGNKRSDYLQVFLQGFRIPVSINGKGGDDQIRGSGGSDVIDGGEGGDVIYGWEGDDHLRGGGGKDTIYGGNGNDRLEGQQGDDVLVGEGGDDRLEGGPGNDRLWGADVGLIATSADPSSSDQCNGQGDADRCSCRSETNCED